MRHATGYCRVTDYDPARDEIQPCEHEHYRDGYCAWHHPTAVAMRRVHDRVRAEAARVRIKIEALREAADDVPPGGWDHVDVQAWLLERAKTLEAAL